MPGVRVGLVENVSATPEPASMTLLGIGSAFCLLGYRLWRRKTEEPTTAA